MKVSFLFVVWVCFVGTHQNPIGSTAQTQQHQFAENKDKSLELSRTKRQSSVYHFDGYQGVQKNLFSDYNEEGNWLHEQHDEQLYDNDLGAAHHEWHEQQQYGHIPPSQDYDLGMDPQDQMDDEIPYGALEDIGGGVYSHELENQNMDFQETSNYDPVEDMSQYQHEDPQYIQETDETFNHDTMEDMNFNQYPQHIQEIDDDETFYYPMEGMRQYLDPTENGMAELTQSSTHENDNQHPFESNYPEVSGVGSPYDPPGEGVAWDSFAGADESPSIPYEDRLSEDEEDYDAHLPMFDSSEISDDQVDVPPPKPPPSLSGTANSGVINKQAIPGGAPAYGGASNGVRFSHRANGQSQISVNRPPTLNGQSPISKNRPPTTNGQSPISINRPPITNGQSPISINRPPITNGQSPISINGPPITNGQFPISINRPPITNGNSQIPVNRSTTNGQSQISVNRSPTTNGRTQIFVNRAPNSNVRLQNKPTSPTDGEQEISNTPRRKVKINVHSSGADHDVEISVHTHHD